MSWHELLTSGPSGWVVAALLVLEFLRRLDKGLIVSGREHTRVQEEREKEAARAEQLVVELHQAQAQERQVLLDRIETQARRLDALMGQREEEST